MTRQRIMRRAGIALAIVAGGYATSAALAQPAPPNSASALNIPTDMTIFGERDPTIRKPTAIVNGEIITQTDVDQRLALVLAANDVEVSAEERQQLQMQVLRNLIDETLQIQEAAANEITIAPAEIDQAFRRVAERSNMPIDRFEAFLRSRGTSPTTMKRQIHGELAWNRLLSRYASVEISQAQIDEIVRRLEATRGQRQYRVAEIWMAVTPGNEAEVAATARRIIDQVRQGASFVAYARQYSQATTAAVGGDLGWVFPAQLPSPLDAAVAQIPVGAVSEPIPNSGGVSIVAVADQRSVLTADPRDAMLSLKQITVRFPAGSTQEQATPLVEQLATAFPVLFKPS
ncbi:MAG: SurA N-terminal domain-containing protein [Sphingomonadaceae bacterium]|nr:SurA N-terminal domain-containing protein [Sphingomonadaceae bacterium]